ILKPLRAGERVGVAAVDHHGADPLRRQPLLGVQHGRRLGQVLGEATRAGAGETLGYLHGWNPRNASSPVVCDQPRMRLRFWTACPAAPFTRLSMAEMATTTSPSAATATWQRLV